MAEIQINVKLADKSGPTFISQVTLSKVTSRTLKNEARTELFTGEFPEVVIKGTDSSDKVQSATGLRDCKVGDTVSLGYRMLTNKDGVPTGKWDYTIF
jgi:hypothetical protein